MGDWAAEVVSRARKALIPLADANRAKGAFAYMKQVAPFLGIATQDRRRALKAAWKDLPAPSSDDLGSAALRLMRQREREFHYAAYDLLAWQRDHADEFFLDAYVTELLTTKSWWDTVDGLVNAIVSPLCLRYDARWLVQQWSESGNRWLIRAAIGHQRGWKSQTDVDEVLNLCDRHWRNCEFFVAKAIGWALRDLAAIDPKAVRKFLRSHPQRNSVAQREAQRGLARV